MPHSRIQIVLCIVWLLALCVRPGVGTRALRLVQVVTRHGDRSPMNALPWGFNEDAFDCKLTRLMESGKRDGDPDPAPLYRLKYMNDEQLIAGTCSLGQLTVAGFQQHVQLGAEFRKRYVDDMKFLPGNFCSAAIYARSTDITRTIQSAQGLLFGLYPDLLSGSQLPEIDLVEMQADILAPNSGLCPRLGTLMAARAELPEYKQRVDDLKPMRDRLAEIFNVSDVSAAWLVPLYDNFFCRQAHGVPLPHGVTQNMVQQLIDFAGFQMGWWFAPQEIQRLAIGQLVSIIQAEMNATVAGADNRLLRLYSAHDTSVGPLLPVFGIYDGIWPPYAASLVFELYGDDSGSFEVEIHYNGAPQKLPGCDGTVCTFDQFLALTTPVIPQDFRKECSASEFDGLEGKLFVF